MTMGLKHSVLIVDDDPDDREAIRDAFYESNRQLDYVFFTGADDMMRYLADAKAGSYPAVILLDLNMPGMDARDALKQVKTSQELRHIPVVVLTTSSSQHDKHTSYSLGANCFITKPDTFNKLVRITESIARLWVA